MGAPMQSRDRKCPCVHARVHTNLCAQRFVRTNPSFPRCFWPFGAKKGVEACTKVHLCTKESSFAWKEAFAVTPLFSSSNAVGCLLLIIETFLVFVFLVYIVAYPWLRGIQILNRSDRTNGHNYYYRIQIKKKSIIASFDPLFGPKRPKRSMKSSNLSLSLSFWLQKAQKVHKGLCTNLCALVRPSC